MSKKGVKQAAAAAVPLIDNRLLPKPLQVTTGEPCSITVNISGVPPPNVRWQIGRKRVKESAKYQLTTDGYGHTLVIARASEDLEQGIWVVASNEHGEDCCNIQVSTKSALKNGEIPGMRNQRPPVGNSTETKSSVLRKKKTRRIGETQSVSSLDAWTTGSAAGGIDDSATDINSTAGDTSLVISSDHNQSLDSDSILTGRRRSAKRTKPRTTRFSSTDGIHRHGPPPPDKPVLQDSLHDVPTPDIKTSATSRSNGDAVVIGVETLIDTPAESVKKTKKRTGSKKTSGSRTSLASSTGDPQKDQDGSRLKDEEKDAVKSSETDGKIPTQNYTEPGDAPESKEDVKGDERLIWELLGMKLNLLCKQLLSDLKPSVDASPEEKVRAEEDDVDYGIGKESPYTAQQPQQRWETDLDDEETIRMLIKNRQIPVTDLDDIERDEMVPEISTAGGTPVDDGGVDTTNTTPVRQQVSKINNLQMGEVPLLRSETPGTRKVVPTLTSHNDVKESSVDDIPSDSNSKTGTRNKTREDQEKSFQENDDQSWPEPPIPIKRNVSLKDAMKTESNRLVEKPPSGKKRTPSTDVDHRSAAPRSPRDTTPVKTQTESPDMKFSNDNTEDSTRPTNSQTVQVLVENDLGDEDLTEKGEILVQETASLARISDSVPETREDTVIGVNVSVPEKKKDKMTEANVSVPVKREDKMAGVNVSVSENREDKMAGVNISVPEKKNDKMTEVNVAVPEKREDKMPGVNVSVSGNREDKITEVKVYVSEKREDKNTEVEVAVPQKREDKITEVKVSVSEKREDRVTEVNVAIPEKRENKITEAKASVPEKEKNKIDGVNVSVPERKEDKVTDVKVSVPEKKKDIMTQVDNAIPEKRADKIDGVKVSVPEKTQDKIIGTDVSAPQNREATETGVDVLSAYRNRVDGVSTPSSRAKPPPPPTPPRQKFTQTGDHAGSGASPEKQSDPVQKSEKPSVLTTYITHRSRRQRPKTEDDTEDIRSLNNANTSEISTQTNPPDSVSVRVSQTPLSLPSSPSTTTRTLPPLPRHGVAGETLESGWRNLGRKQLDAGVLRQRSKSSDREERQNKVGFKDDDVSMTETSLPRPAPRMTPRMVKNLNRSKSGDVDDTGDESRSDSTPDSPSSPSKPVPKPRLSQSLLKPAKSEEFLASKLSDSPTRTIRLTGNRKGLLRNARSVESLGSGSDSFNPRMGKRTMSKEWQVVTVTTTEEIVVIDQPKSKKEADGVGDQKRENVKNDEKNGSSTKPPKTTTDDIQSNEGGDMEKAKNSTLDQPKSPSEGQKKETAEKSTGVKKDNYTETRQVGDKSKPDRVREVTANEKGAKHDNSEVKVEKPEQTGKELPREESPGKKDVKNTNEVKLNNLDKQKQGVDETDQWKDFEVEIAQPIELSRPKKPPNYVSSALIILKSSKSREDEQQPSTKSTRERLTSQDMCTQTDDVKPASSPKSKDKQTTPSNARYADVACGDDISQGDRKSTEKADDTATPVVVYEYSEMLTFFLNPESEVRIKGPEPAAGRLELRSDKPARAVVTENPNVIVLSPVKNEVLEKPDRGEKSQSNREDLNSPKRGPVSDVRSTPDGDSRPGTVQYSQPNTSGITTKMRPSSVSGVELESMPGNERKSPSPLPSRSTPDSLQGSPARNSLSPSVDLVEQFHRPPTWAREQISPTTQAISRDTTKDGHGTTQSHEDAKIRPSEQSSLDRPAVQETSEQQKDIGAQEQHENSDYIHSTGPRICPPDHSSLDHPAVQETSEQQKDIGAQEQRENPDNIHTTESVTDVRDTDHSDEESRRSSLSSALSCETVIRVTSSATTFDVTQIPTQSALTGQDSSTPTAPLADGDSTDDEFMDLEPDVPSHAPLETISSAQITGQQKDIEDGNEDLPEGAIGGNFHNMPNTREGKKDERRYPSPSDRPSHDSTDDMLAEKACVHSALSSLGTIIFLALAAIIFHFLNHIVGDNPE